MDRRNNTAANAVKTAKSLLRMPEWFYGKARTTVRRVRTQKCNALRNTYGIDLYEYEEMLAFQQHVCAICNKTEPTEGRQLAVDHCHDTGEVRGLLCGKCNKAIGLLNDDINLIRDAAKYLATSQGG